MLRYIFDRKMFTVTLENPNHGIRYDAQKSSYCVFLNVPGNHKIRVKVLGDLEEAKNFNHRSSGDKEDDDDDNNADEGAEEEESGN